jgi:sporulation protein YlmC with PRC-barrel domain
MKSLLLGTVMAVALSAAAAAQSTNDASKAPASPTATPPANTTVNPPPNTAARATPTPNADTAAKATPTPADTTAQTAGAGEFVTQQEKGQLRAPKLVGVAVYDSQNKSVGKIDDLILDKDGAIKAVVIGIGGFLGIGRKDVALPYSAIHWQTEERTVATNEPPPATSGNATTPAQQPQAKKIDPAATEAYNGYPDRAVIDMSQAQLKAAPEFKYANDPATSAAKTTDRAPEQK